MSSVPVRSTLRSSAPYPRNFRSRARPPSRSDGWAPARRSGLLRCSWPPPTPASSPAQTLSSTAGSARSNASDDQRSDSCRRAVRDDVVSLLTMHERPKETSMPDYGHPLRFATFIGPTNSPPSRPVELAQLSERLGFDFVTFQDHPYQSSFLDT